MTAAAPGARRVQPLRERRHVCRAGHGRGLVRPGRLAIAAPGGTIL